MKNQVALLAEGVDRNSGSAETFGAKMVALLAEGVDRNSAASRASMSASRSPSSRRAWIEIGLDLQQRQRREVALLAEGVDRNFLYSAIPCL